MNKSLILLASLIFSVHAFASWSRYAYVSPKTEREYELGVHVAPLNPDKTTYLVRLKAVSFPSKQAWLIVASTPLSSKEQNQRSRVWSEQLNVENVESIVPLRPKGIPMFQSMEKHSQDVFYEVVIPASQASRTYIYIDFPTHVRDGGYFYSIDIGSYIAEGK